MYFYRYKKTICTTQNLRSTAHDSSMTRLLSAARAIFGPPGICKWEKPAPMDSSTVDYARITGVGDLPLQQSRKRNRINFRRSRVELKLDPDFVLRHAVFRREQIMHKAISQEGPCYSHRWPCISLLEIEEGTEQLSVEETAFAKLRDWTEGKQIFCWK